ncbi:MAG: hypothetical protein AAF755_04080 [Pseudomonadota bacterium]
MKEDGQDRKVLTVSYGAFSCTLEGFDEPIEALKVVTEYFRELSARDQYFASEPQKPDQGSLSKVVQEEEKKDITLQEKNGELVLTARNASDPAVAQTDAPEAAEPETQTENARTPVERQTTIVAGQLDAEVEAFFAGSSNDAEPPNPAQGAPTTADPETPATASETARQPEATLEEKLARIRSAVADNDAGTAEQPEGDAEVKLDDVPPDVIAKARALAEAMDDETDVIENIFEDVPSKPFAPPQQSAGNDQQATAETPPSDQAASSASASAAAAKAARQKTALRKPPKVQPYLELARPTIDFGFSKKPVAGASKPAQKASADNAAIQTEPAADQEKSEEAEQEISRLVTQTNQQMTDETHQDRQDDFEHLRAAAAVQETLPPPGDNDQDEALYRADLSAALEGKAEVASMPLLRLSEEQRVDTASA